MKTETLTHGGGDAIFPRMGTMRMLSFLVRTDGAHGTQRITIPKMLRSWKKWDDVVLYKLRLREDGTVTIESFVRDSEDHE